MATQSKGLNDSQSEGYSSKWLIWRVCREPLLVLCYLLLFLSAEVISPSCVIVHTAICHVTISLPTCTVTIQTDTMSCRHTMGHNVLT